MRQPRARRPVVGVYRVGLSRRAWSPLDLKPDLWLRADRGITLNAGAVSDWADQSGTGNASMMQSTGGAQPAFAPNAINGWPAVLFDGTTDYMTAQVTGLGTSLTLIVVMRRAALSALNAGAMSLLDGTANDFNRVSEFTVYEKSASQNEIEVFRNSAAGANSPTHPGNGVAFMQTVRFDGTNSLLRVAGVDRTPVASSGSFSAATNIQIGARWGGGVATSFWNGHIAEAVFVKRSIADDELNRMEAYVLARYGCR